MNLPRIIHWLRIVATAVCVIIFGLLICLWVRSTRFREEVTLFTSSTHFHRVGSVQGKVYDQRLPLAQPIPDMPYFGGYLSQVVNKDYWANKYQGTWGFGARQAGALRERIVPYWFLVLLLGLLAASPWLDLLPRRFSLKTLLIVTAVASALMGLLVWLTR